MLNDSCIEHRRRDEAEANGDTGDRSEVYASAMKEGIENLLDQRCEDDATDLIHCRYEIVWCAVSLHLSSLRDQIVLHLVETNVEDHKGNEDTAGLQTPGDLVDKLTAPRDGVLTVLELVFGLRVDHFEAMSTRACDDPGCCWEHIALMWCLDVPFLTSDDHNSGNDHEAKTKCVC